MLVVVYIAFTCCLLIGELYFSYNFITLFIPMLTLSYLTNKQIKKPLFFTLFLIIYSISDLIFFLIDILGGSVYYYGGNIGYSLAHLLMIIYIAKNLNFKHVLRYYKFSIIVLTALNVYIARKLLDIVLPESGPGPDPYMEFSYSMIMLMMLSFALINYFYNESRKAFYILVGTLCILFAEVLNIAYYYIAEEPLFIFITCTVGLTGFLFLHAQVKLRYKPKTKKIQINY